MAVSVVSKGLMLAAGGVLLFAWAACGVDETDVTGKSPLSITSDATWERGSRVEISGRLTVDGATLTIEPGVRVRMAPGAQIVVGHTADAALRIDGSDAEPVIFESQDPARPWLGIQLLGTLPSSRIGACEIRQAGSRDVAALRIAKLNFPVGDLGIHEAVGVGMQVESVDMSAGASLRDVAVHSRGGHGVVGDGSWLGALRGGLKVRVPEGYGVHARGGVVRGDKLDLPDLKVPYVIDGPIQMDVKDLDLGDGNAFQFTSRGELDLGCNASTKVEADRCVFTSVETAKQPGQWKGITCNTYVQPGSVFEGCRFEAAGASEPAGALVLYDCKDLVVRNCRFERNRGYGIVLVDQASLSATSLGNTFVGNGQGHVGRVRGRWR